MGIKTILKLVKKLDNIYNYTYDKLTNYFLDNGEKKFRAEQVFKEIYRKTFIDFSEISTISKKVRQTMSETFTIKTIELIELKESENTKKALFKLKDGHCIETVLMKQHYGYSVCVTTQVGCNMSCDFCASGLEKKLRNLEVHEMVEQVLYFHRSFEERISHLVVMGIGEPFDNYENVMKFLSIVNDDRGLGIGARHITISTSGLVDKIMRFSELKTQYNLAISLHAADDKLRTKLMPINKKYDLKALKDALIYYNNETSRRLTIEYVLIEGVNDSKIDALNLVKYLRGIHCYVNLIPLNPVSQLKYKRPSEKKIQEFATLLEKQNVNVRIRKEFGEEINAACGQLKIKG